MGKSVSQHIANFALNLKLDDVPKDIVDKSKQLLLDAVGLCFAATDMECSKIAFQLAQEFGGIQEATVIGKSCKVPAVWAVWANGTQIHAHDYDDTHAGSVAHTTSVIVPIVLALAERNRLNGQQILEALTIGLEICCRVGKASQGGFHKRGFHTTALAGAMGGAVASAKMLGLDANQICHAQGIAGSAAAGLREAYLSGGSWTKMFHPAWAAHGAVVAALMAQKGYTGTPTVYEGRFGLFKSHLHPGDADYRILADDLGMGWEIRNINFKPYPCGVINHAFIESVLWLCHNQDFSPEDIRRINCYIHPDAAQTVCEPVASKRRPESGYHAKFSLQFAVAAALVDKEITLKTFTDEKVRNPYILKIADKVEYRIDPDSPYPHTYPGRLKIKLKDGRIFKQHQPHNKGSQAHPMTKREITDKFFSNAEFKISRAKAEKLYACIQQLEEMQDSTLLSDCLND